MQKVLRMVPEYIEPSMHVGYYGFSSFLCPSSLPPSLPSFLSFVNGKTKVFKLLCHKSKQVSGKTTRNQCAAWYFLLLQLTAIGSGAPLGLDYFFQMHQVRASRSSLLHNSR